MKYLLTFVTDVRPVRRTGPRKGMLAASIAALLALASPDAFAADVSIRGPAAAPGPNSIYYPPPIYTPFYNWTGFYIGGNLGGAWETGSLTDNFTGASFSNTRSGFIGGGQIGYNWQVSPVFVLGVEWMFDGTDISSDTDFVTAPTLFGPRTFRASANVDWITTLAARFGYAANNWLFYGKAGGAWVHDSATVTDITDGISVSASDTKGGLVLGVGVEYGFTPNWTARVEWDHISLNDVTRTGFVILSPIDTINLSRSFDLLTVGLNYKFTGF
jgi:outer membrane immunogenic protein